MRLNQRRLITVTALTLVLSVAACDDAPDEADADITAGRTAEQDPEVQADITEHPIQDPLLNTDRYVGQSVTVTSDVEAILGTHAFTLAAPQGPFLVVSATGIGRSPVIERGAAVQVQGTVRDRFSVRGFEDEFAVDLDDDAVGQFEERTYVVADSVTEPEDGEGT